MSAEKLIADRISGSGQDNAGISKPIVKIGVIGITIGFSVMLLAVSIVLGFKKEIVNKITGLTTHIAISSVDVDASNEPQPIRISEDTLSLIKQLPFVKHLQRTAFKNAILKTAAENEGVLLKGVDTDYDFGFIKEHMVAGRLPQYPKDAAGKEILISDALSKRLNLVLNQKMLVYFISQRTVFDSVAGEKVITYEQRSRSFIICGIFKTSFADFDEKLSMVDLRQLQRLNYWDSSQVGNYEITVTDFKQLEEDQEKVQDLLGYSYNVNSVKNLYMNIFTWLDQLDINGIVVVVLMILVATINMITALLILILERTNMVGLVKALGMSNVSVRKIFLYISFRLIGKGLLWGNIIGIALCLLQYHFKIARLDPETYYVNAVAIEINWLYFLLLNVGTFLTCAVMMLLPTIIITRLTPIKTLKFD